MEASMKALMSGLAVPCPAVTKIQSKLGHLHYVWWVNWAGFPYLLPAYPCSLSYCMICALELGESFIPCHCHSLLSYLFWTHWEAHGFLCEDAPLATTSVWGISHLNIASTLCASSSPTWDQTPLPSLQQSPKLFWYKTSNSSAREHIFPVTSAKKKHLEHQCNTMTLGPGFVSQFCCIWPEWLSISNFISLYFWICYL